MSSFANFKKSTKTQFKQLADKMSQENKGGNYEDNRFWFPDIDKSGSGFAIIRFLPATEGTETPYVKTYSHGFKVGTKWYVEGCPTTIGQPCPVCDLNTELWATEIKENQEIARRRKRVLRYISNIIVLSDAKRPQNEGKVFLFSYGAKIFAKLVNAIEPEFEDENAFNPFDFWEGAPFKIKIRNVENYRNYDKSEFGECGPLFEDDDATEQVWKSQYDLSEFTSAKNFKKYEDLKARLFSVINASPTARQYSSKDDDDNSNDEVVTLPEPKKAEKISRPSKSENKSIDDDDDDFELFQNMIDE